MPYTENFHTHTLFCDGKNTPEEMVKSAIEKGFTALGFSGHSYIDFECGWCMTKEGTKEYIKTIRALAEKYVGEINIYCGTEHDVLSSINKSDYDYTLGAVHYLSFGDEHFDVDASAQCQLETAERFLGGSMIEYAIQYFREAGTILDRTDADIIAHFDLLTKFNEHGELFDTSDRRYILAYTEALDMLIPYGKPFEINTGAIARGKRETPYPSIEIADYIHSKGGYFILTSDCHNAAMLDCYYDEALKMYSKYNIVSFEEILKNNQTQ